MGITVHYQLEYEGTDDEVVDLLQKVGGIAGEIGFKEYQTLWKVDYATHWKEVDQWTPTRDGPDRKPDESYQWAKLQYEPTPLILIRPGDSPEVRQQKQRERVEAEQCIHEYSGWAQQCWFGEGCEPTNIGLIHRGGSTHWTGSAFTKTEWSSEFAEAHISVCALLKRIEDLGILKSVSDEAGFYETWDTEKLLRSRQLSSESMARVTAILQQFQQTTGCEIHCPGS